MLVNPASPLVGLVFLTLRQLDRQRKPPADQYGPGAG